MDTLAIIKRIELRLAELGMTKAEFYKKSGISSASFSQWNTGKYNPSKVKIQHAATVLGLDPDYLFYGLEQKNESPSEIELTEGEKKLINLFRKVPADRRELVFQMIDAALSSL